MRKPVSVFGLLRSGLIIVCVSLLLSPLESRGAEQELERVKIAFVYKFLSLVEWPESEEDSSPSDLVLGVLGNHSLFQSFSVLDGRYIREREILIKSVDHGELGASRFHVLYLAKSHGKRFDQRSVDFGNDAVLTIAEEGRGQLPFYMIIIYEQDGFVRFDINNTLARSKGIQLNAKLLELAGRVI